MNKRKVPKIRFKGFYDDWEQRKLSEMCGTFEYGLNAAAKEFDGKNKYIRITDIDDASREFLLSDLSSPDICLDGMSKYILSSGDIVFARTGASVGKTYIYRENDGIVYFAGFLIRAKVNQDNDAEFVFQSTLSPSYEKYIRITSQRSGQPGVNAQEYGEYDLFAPSKEEQQRIGHFLRGIDNLITLHQRKLEKLKIIKKSMLENCFPKNGEKAPKIRFSGFSDDWEQRKFGEVFMSLQNNTLSRAELNDEFGIAQNIHYGDVLIKYDDVLDVSKEPLSYIEKQSIADKFKTSYLQNGDVIIADTAEDETVGKCTEIEGLTDQKVISGLHTMPVRPNRKFAAGFLGFYLNSAAYHDQLKPLMQGIKVTSISKGAMQDTVVKFPLDLKEQEQIGMYFSGLDHLITLHQSKLEKLKMIKKSMLETMFV
ncbi:restriction endonuclease subunit S [Oribacterium sp. P9]|uniref:restriction endonuclease subunit S n=1 Tax=Oribacterium sp. P9 TaxID=3378068 RepID=UPI0039679B71